MSHTARGITGFITAMEYVVGKRCRGRLDMPAPHAAVGTADVWEAVEETWELAAMAARRTLDTAGCSPELVIYATQTSPPDSLGQFLRAARIDRAAAQIVTGSGCANFGVGLRTATDSLRTGEIGSVLLVTADGMDSGRPRFDPSSQALLSDGAAACLVRPETQHRSFEVLACATGIDATVDPSARDLSTGRATIAGVRAVVQRVCNLSGLDPEDFGHLVTNNYGHQPKRLVEVALSLPHAVLAGNGLDAGHFFAADPILNLRRLERQHELQDGDLLLVVPTGLGAWAAVAVRYVAGTSHTGRT